MSIQEFTKKIEQHREAFIAGGLAFAVLFFGFMLSDINGYWWDELWSVDAASGSFKRMLLLTAQDVHPPGYHALLWIWVRIFGPLEQSTHMLSAVAMAATCALVFLTARRLELSTTASIAASLGTALSYASVYVIQETRPYGVLMALVVAATFPLLATGFSWSRFAAAAGLGLLAMSAHYGALFVLPAAVLVFSVRAREKRWLLLPVVWFAVVVLLGPLIQQQANQFSKVSWVTRPDVARVKSALVYAFGAFQAPIISVAALACGLGAMALRRRFMRDAWFMVPVVMLASVIAISYLIQPVFHERYLFPLQPWFFLSFAYLVDLPPIKILRVGLAIGLVAFAVHGQMTIPITKAEDWRAPMRAIQTRPNEAQIVTTARFRFFQVYDPNIKVFADDDTAAVDRWVSENVGETFWVVQARDYTSAPASRRLAQQSELLERFTFKGSRALYLRVTGSH